MLGFFVVLLLVGFPALIDEGPHAAGEDERAPVTFDDARSLYRQNQAGLRPLRVRWRLQISYSDTYRRVVQIPPSAATGGSQMEFWTNGVSWRAMVPWGKKPRRLPTHWLVGTPREVASRAGGYHILVYDGRRDVLLVVTGDQSQESTGAAILRSLAGFDDVFPPLNPIRGHTRSTFQTALHLMDQVMEHGWTKTRHICAQCKPEDGVHYFELLGRETPHASYLTPEERKRYRHRVRRYTGWIVEVDFNHAAIPLRLWRWDRTYFDGKDVTPVSPMNRVERDIPIMEVRGMQRVTSRGYYPQVVVVRRLIPTPESLASMPGFEERVLRRGRRYAYEPTLGVEREWTVLAIEAGIDSPQALFDSGAAGGRVYDARRLRRLSDNSPGESARLPTDAVEPAETTGPWVPFAIGCALALAASALVMGLWRARRCS